MDVDRAAVLAMAEAARSAPSLHNSQPWTFRSRDDGLDVLVDTSRSLPAVDPTGRLRRLSCGAAAAAAGVASTSLGLGTRTALLPDGPRGELVARVVCVARRTPTTADLRLAAAAPYRRSHPVLHPGEGVGPDRLEDVAVTVADEGVVLTVLDESGRVALVDLVHQAVAEHQRRPALMAEAEAWLREPTRARRTHDGVLRPSLSTWPGPAGSPLRQAPAAPPDPSSPAELQGSGDGTVVLLSTTSDSRRDHVVAGIALHRLLLHVTALDLVASFCDIATQLPDTRARMRRLLPRHGHVQVALRLGRQLVDVRTPPRRPLSDLLDTDPAGRPGALDLAVGEAPVAVEGMPTRPRGTPAT